LHALQAALAADPQVLSVEPESREPLSQVSLPQPSDPLFGADGQWWLLAHGGSNANDISLRRRGLPGLQPAWARSTGASGIVVAVLDTGITAHPDLDPARLLPGYDLVSDWDAATGLGYANDGDGRDADPTDPGDWVDAADQAADPARYQGCTLQPSDWHGTVVTGLLAAATDNALGVAGATWAGQVLPVRVAGKCGAAVGDIVDGMRWAAGLPVCRTFSGGKDASQGCAVWAPLNPHPARVINISFGGTAACSNEYQSAIDEVRALGVLIVAAAGNQHGAPTRPASCLGVLGVASVNRDGFKAAYSNFGAALGLATVGGDDSTGAWATWLSDGGLLSIANLGATVADTPGYARHAGTSFAAPLVAATASLMLALDPALDGDALKAGLQASARPHVGSTVLPRCGVAAAGRCLCSNGTCGAGLLDSDQALAWAWAQAHPEGGPWVAPTWPAETIDNDEVRRAVASGPDLEQASGGGTGSAGSSSGGGGAWGPVAALGLLAAVLALRGRPGDRPGTPGGLRTRRRAARTCAARTRRR